MSELRDPKTQQKKRLGIWKLIKKGGTSVNDSVKGQDAFGTGVALNFRGEETFNTFPGGIMSIVMLFASLCYTFMKAKEMIYVQDWTLV